jgi:ABC-2 type transport system ATP-binding protein
MTPERHPRHRNPRTVRRFGRTEAVHGLDLTVPAGSCYGFFGRNGAGKTTTIKCLLNLLRNPTRARCASSALDPATHELEVKRRIAYVPDQVAFYPWMSVRDALDYAASFRAHWNTTAENDLLDRFRLDVRKPVTGLSKGQRTQLALISAICADPDLLVLDEPTSGLDPSCAASSSKRSSAPTRTPIRADARCSSPPT